MKYIITLNGKRYEVEVTKTEAAITGVTAVSAPSAPASAPVPAPAPVAPPPAVGMTPAGPVSGEKILSPMPGNILSVNVSAGQAVKAGQVLFILEAMKMENEIVAPRDGTLKQVLAVKGQTVDTDALLAVM